MVGTTELPDYLRRSFPQTARIVAEVERSHPDTPVINAYSHMSEAFWWGTFQPAIEESNLRVLRRCFAAMEEFLGSPDDDLRDAVGIRVTPQLCAPELRGLVAQHAGPLLRADLLRLNDRLPEG